MNYRITAIKRQTRNTHRVNVFLDGEFAFSLARIVAAWLKVDQVITEAEITNLKNEDAQEAAHQMAVRYINYRPRSEREVIQHLKSKSITERNIDQVIQRLREIGLINDMRFAHDWVENRCLFHPRSKRALAYELNHHGVQAEDIEIALRDLDDLELAIQAGGKQAKKVATTDWKVFRKKMLGYLGRRGFDYGTSIQVIKHVWENYQNNNMTTREVN